ncbi:MAG: hypothetical protein U0T83_01445 [Bacteriovoracaceae bacterium]
MKTALIKIFSLVFIFNYFTAISFATPAQVVIIRHAEKPELGRDLSTIGWERAQNLPIFFKNNSIVAFYGDPVGIYGFAPQSNDGSLRGIQTVSFLAEQLKLKVNSNYTKNEYAKMVKKIMANKEYEGKTVVICWQHSFLVRLALEFGAKGMIPDEWNDNVYNRAWILRFYKNSVKEFFDVPQLLLRDDT